MLADQGREREVMVTVKMMIVTARMREKHGAQSMEEMMTGERGRRDEMLMVMGGK